uniref:Uncharacterized protein n=1 Tax=Peronospora matthiolae TaxID=2874970 RepID=A0AAV1T0L6_9STRA
MVCRPEDRGLARVTRKVDARTAVATLGEASRQKNLQLPTACTAIAQTAVTSEIHHAKDSKLNIRVFTGKELHKGLGAKFKLWGRVLQEDLEMAQEACIHAWPETYKISRLVSYLRAEAEEFFYGLRDEWCSMEKTLAYAMKEIESAFSRTFYSAKVADFFGRSKPATES